MRLLGSPEIIGCDGGFTFPGKGFQLLALLCRRYPNAVRRAEAAALLWGDRPDAVALANLRQLLARFRDLEHLAGVLVVPTRETIALGPDRDRIDLVAFESFAASPGRPIRHLQLFRGDLLDGLGPVSAEFEEWLRPERLVLRERFFAVATDAIGELTRYGRTSARDLGALAAQMIALEGTREATYRTLIEAYGRCGYFDEAKSLIARLSDMCRREWGEEPGPETAAVVRRVHAAARASVAGAEAAPRADQPRPRVALLAPLWLQPDANSRLVQAVIEDVANELSRYRSFTVLAPESSFQVANDFGGQVDNSQLLATHVVSGFVKPASGADRLALRMVKTDTGEINWAAEFPIDVEDLAGLFRVTSVRIASSIASELERGLLDEARRSSATDAYRHYLDGQQGLKSCDLRMLRRARSAFKAAVQADDRFAPAHARLAQTLFLEWLALGGDDPSLLRAARERAELAIGCDEGASLGHLMTGVVALYQRDFDYSGEKFAEAEALNPNSADLLVEHADALAYFGEAAAGWTKFEQATELNPLGQDHHWWAGASIAFNGGNFTKAIDLCARVESQDTVLRLLAASHALTGDLAAARQYGAQLKEQFPGKSAADHLKLAPFRRPADVLPMVEGLRMAGVP